MVCAQCSWQTHDIKAEHVLTWSTFQLTASFAVRVQLILLRAHLAVHSIIAVNIIGGSTSGLGMWTSVTGCLCNCTAAR